MSATYDAEDDDFDVEDVIEDSEDDEGGGMDEAEEVSSSESLLTSNGLGRVFLVSTAKTTGGHRPSCTFEGDLYEVCMSTSPGGGGEMTILVFQSWEVAISHGCMQPSHPAHHMHRTDVPHHPGAFLQRVIQADDPSPLALSLRYEPPSPKFSRMHPALTSYRRVSWCPLGGRRINCGARLFSCATQGEASSRVSVHLLAQRSPQGMSELLRRN